jgi:hypothetical protein
VSPIKWRREGVNREESEGEGDKRGKGDDGGGKERRNCACR